MSLLALCAFLALVARTLHWRVGGMLWSAWVLTAMLGVLAALR